MNDQSTLDAVTQPPSEGTRRSSGFSYASESGEIPNGSMVGAYEVSHQLGRGGMGVVYSATHSATGQKVAIKLLNQGPDDSPKAAERFHRESQIAASISNPRSTFVYASGEYEGRRFIVMELMPGETLKDLVKKNGKLPVGRAVDLILDVITGIQSAHRRGIVHRDIKPSNCFIDHDGRIKIGDYGLSKSYDTDVQLTKTGTFMGTLQFAAPEQVKGAKVDERTDIYAIGATLYYLITGEPPYDGDAAQVIAGIASDPIPNIRKKVDRIPPKLARIITQMLDKDPKSRPNQLADIRQQLLPFASQGATNADIGRRFAAFFVDFIFSNFIVGISFVMVGIVISIIFTSFFAKLGSDSPLVANLILVGTLVFAMILYFAICEGIWGRGLGKLMFGMRVVDQRGGAPGILRALPRAIGLPGALLFGTVILPVLFTGQLNNPNTMNSPVLGQLTQFGSTLLGWSLALLLLVTCRKANGYRGIHELFTNTHVVRIGSALAAPVLDDVPETLPEVIEKPFQVGEGDDAISAIGLIGKTDTGAIYLAKDQKLDRNVWLVEDKDFVDSIDDVRKQVNRPGRQRILDYHLPENHICLEAISGTPIHELIDQIKILKWETVRLTLESIVVELISSVEDKTLPQRLSIDQIWIDAEGNAKLIDLPLKSGAKSTVSTKTSPEGRAIAVFQAVLKQVARKMFLSGHVVDFISEIKDRHEDISTLNWIRARLHQFEKKPSSWGWDDRFGTLATSFGTESSVNYFVVFCLAMALKFGLGMGAFAIVLIAFPVLSLISFSVGYLFRGGPVFQVCGVEVRNRKNQIASPLVCGVRNFLAWSPSNLFWSFFAALLTTFMIQQQEILGAQFSGAFFLVASIAILLTSLIVMIGCLQSLLSPARSIPDYVLGTYITRR